jgi:hypothetical protein
VRSRSGAAAQRSSRPKGLVHRRTTIRPRFGAPRDRMDDPRRTNPIFDIVIARDQ